MILDTQNLFSNSQAVTASAASANTIDLNSGLQDAPMLSVLISVREDALAAGAATVQFQLQGSDTSDFASPTIIAETDAIPKATLVAGYSKYLRAPVGLSQRYLRMYYNVSTGPLTAGKFTTGFVEGEDVKTSYPSRTNS